MDTQKFENICRASGFEPIRKEFTSRGNILLAEKVCKDEEIHSSPWVETLWTAERADCNIAQIVRNDFAAVRRGIARTITLEDRVKDAIEAANDWFTAADAGAARAKSAAR